MNTTIERMRADIARLKEERAKIDAELEQLEIALPVVARYASETDEPTPRNRLRITSFQTVDSKTKVVMTMARQAVFERGSIHTAELLELIKQRGVELPGENPEQYLSSILSRKKDEYGLQVDRRMGWSLKAQNEESPSATNTEASGVQPESVDDLI